MLAEIAYRVGRVIAQDKRRINCAGDTAGGDGIREPEQHAYMEGMYA